MEKMLKKIKSQKHSIAFTLLECMIAVVLLMIIFGAIMTFRYYTVACAERAENQLMAARSAYLLSEAWKGQHGDSSFDPTQQDFDSDFQISTLISQDLLDVFPVGSYSEKLQNQFGLSVLGNYSIRIDDKQFWARLLYGEEAGIPDLRSIHVLVVWQDHWGMRYECYLPTLAQG